MKGPSFSQKDAPYFQALKRYLEENNQVFHIPGHRAGLSLPSEFAELLREYQASADITEVLGIDDIHSASEQCAKAQSLAAQAYGSDHCYFLVNGSTVGIQAMYLATLGPQDTVILPRASHRSVFAALTLCGAKAHFFETDLHPELLCALPPKPQQVRKAIAECPQAKAVFFTSPNYHGACAQVDDLVSEIHLSEKLALVDEAWGSHLRFSSQLPRSAVEAGADLVCQSMHKLTAGLTQTALLHGSGNKVDWTRLQSVLRHLQTSSPSSLLVASIDCARRQMATEGQKLWNQALDFAAELRQEIEKQSQVECFIPDMGHWDGSRIILNATRIGYTGYELAQYLRSHHRIQAEMWEAHQVLLMVGPGSSEQAKEALLTALIQIPKKTPSVSLEGLKEQAHEIYCAVQSQSEMSLREAFEMATISVNLKEAVDRRSAELLYCYPPGVPLLHPGQVVSKRILEHIRTQQKLGGSIYGSADPKLETIQVLDCLED